MSHGLAVAVATTLLSELGICDLQTFTNMVRHDTKGVLAALESDACRAAADAAAVEPAAASTAADAVMAVQVMLMRNELQTVEQTVAELRISASPPTIQRASMAASWQRRSELPSLRAAAAADRKAAAAEKKAAAAEKKAAAVERAEAAALLEAAAAEQHAAEKLMQTATAKLADASQKLCDARELRESVSAGFEKAAREIAAVDAAHTERKSERATSVQLQSELASVTAAAAAAEQERAKAERQIERVEAQMVWLKGVESILRAELWDVENEYAEQREVWERERSVGCALLCHPLVLRARGRGRARTGSLREDC